MYETITNWMAWTCKRDCPIRYIVTVEKLREGWDCPFAYVLGSVGNVATETAVEQLLGPRAQDATSDTDGSCRVGSRLRNRPKP